MPFDEISLVLEKSRHELSLSGPTASEKMEKEGLDERVYGCQTLNFLDISDTCLKNLDAKINNLINLTNLVLRGNQLVEVPPEIGQLSKLKLVDLSRNKIRVLPNDIANLKQIQTLNLSFNELENIPEIESLISLAHLDISHNKLEHFPPCLTEKSLVHLNELLLNDNCISIIPPEVSNVASLKILDLSENKILNVPGELSDCMKLKEIRLKSNKLKDRRLGKLVDQCHYKQILEYIRAHCPKVNMEVNAATSKTKGKGKKKKGALGKEEVTHDYSIKVLHVSDKTPVVKSTENVSAVRPYIVCCIVRNVNFLNQDVFKNFISVQTKLHDTICEKRNVATIATHDLIKINGNLLYNALDPKTVMIQPLMRNKAVPLATLYQQLREEAEALRKEKKRNVFSGIHKYLYLLDHKTVFPFLSDATEAVISFPPITNSDASKISPTTTDLFLEVTSSVNHNKCKKVMDELLLEMVKSNIANVDETINNLKHLTVEQVKVTDEEFNLKVVYPSRTDLNFDDVDVIYE